ncbi:hypothetical protein EPI10_001203 [Gossypium australe]|uniref:Uncharacterized protein n=1 Tax=Gossypium australe TaxID=47621 RepID=A0A5B6VAA5_9ROSI|nr:hypothetical protein EPI10_001203 [Gossypium australe]
MEKQLEDFSYIANRARNPYSNTYNPNWKDHLNLKWEVNAIALRSGKQLNNPKAPIHEEDKSTEVVDKPLGETSPKGPIEEVPEPIAKLVTSKSSTIKVPLSSRLDDKQERDEVDFVSFFNLFKSLNVNFLTLELINKILKYANDIITKKIPHKLTDLDSFTIPVEIGDRHFNKALCDLEARVRGSKKNTSITLQLAYRSLVQPKGVSEDVLVKVRTFTIPIGFVILNFEEDREIPILLGRPFLATSKSTIDLKKMN